MFDDKDAELITQAVLQALKTHSVAADETLLTAQHNIEDIGGGETLQKELIEGSGLRFANNKRTADEYQQVSLDGTRQNRVHFDKLISDHQAHDAALRNASLIALTNAIESGNLRTKDILESANMVGKQAVRHADLAIDRQWNVDEQTWSVEKIVRSSVFNDAVAAIVAKALGKDE